MTYEERLHEYAQKHADKWNDINIGPNSWEVKKKSGNMINEAKVTCAAVAEGIRNYSKMCKKSVSIISVDTFLKKNGYMPNP